LIIYIQVTLVIMSDILRAYFFHIHGIRNIRYAAPEFLKSVNNRYQLLTPQEKYTLKQSYEKNKSKVFKFLEIW